MRSSPVQGAEVPRLKCGGPPAKGESAEVALAWKGESAEVALTWKGVPLRSELAEVANKAVDFVGVWAPPCEPKPTSE